MLLGARIDREVGLHPLTEVGGEAGLHEIGAGAVGDLEQFPALVPFRHEPVGRDVAGDLVGTIGQVLAPVPFYGLGAFVCMLQAFVYSLLTTVYVSLSTADMSHGHDDHDHKDHHHPEHA